MVAISSLSVHTYARSNPAASAVSMEYANIGLPASGMRFLPGNRLLPARAGIMHNICSATGSPYLKRLYPYRFQRRHTVPISQTSNQHIAKFEVCCIVDVEAAICINAG